jgi:hypothetical protein
MPASGSPEVSVACVVVPMRGCGGSVRTRAASDIADIWCCANRSGALCVISEAVWAAPPAPAAALQDVQRLIFLRKEITCRRLGTERFTPLRLLYRKRSVRQSAKRSARDAITPSRTIREKTCRRLLMSLFLCVKGLARRSRLATVAAGGLQNLTLPLELIQNDVESDPE